MASIEFRSITKRFPGVLALDNVSFAIRTGSCHALIGENGAGKSTLGKILAGVHTADSGSILLDGVEVHPTDPLVARRLGISMVHQELAFCPNLTVAENLCLGDLPRRAGFVQRGRMRERARRMLAEIEADLDVDRPIGELSTGQEQVVQIAAAVGTGARVVVMDEPTSSLSAQESEHLFHLLAQLRERGITVIYVSHRMEEIFRLCDTITVLRDGRHVDTSPAAGTRPDDVIRRMIGREVDAREPAHVAAALGEEVLRVEGLGSPGRFRDIGFTLRRGEVLGVAGLVGAGRSEIAQAIVGLDGAAKGRVWVEGNDLPLGRPGLAFRRGVGFLPEDRKRLGLVLGMNCRENVSLASLDRVSGLGFVRFGVERELVARHTARLRVKAPSFEVAVQGLSGGNQQKIALAKWLARECRVLIVDEPTRGVDVGSKAEIHALLDELAVAGMGILVISSELPELLYLSRRVLVIRGGALVGELPRAEFSEERLMRLMTGVESAAVAGSS